MTEDCSKACIHGNVTADNRRCECEPCYAGADCNSECSRNGYCEKDGCICFRDIGKYIKL